MNVKFSRLLTILFVSLGIGGIIGLGSALVFKYLQTQQMQQMQQANNLLAQGKYALAITAYDQLLKSNSAQPDILWANRGAALLKLHHYQKAWQSCSQATSLNQLADLAWNCQGEALYYLGQNDQAAAAFKQAIAINAQNTTFWLNQNQVLFDLGRHEQAIEASKQAINLLQSEPATSSKEKHLVIAWTRQGQSYLELKQNQLALTAFDQSLTYQSHDLTTQQARGIALYRLGYYHQAIQTFTQLLQQNNLTDQQQASSWLYKGVSLCHTPQADSAKEAFTQVLQLTQDLPAKKIAQAGCGIR